MTETINILLPTHNSAKFLLETLESITGQSYQRLLLTVRDDESTDATYELLLEYAASHSNIRVTRGEGLGAAKSFLYLLQNADPDCEYFGFCDHDDVWLPNKVEHAIATLRKYGSTDPVMYCSRLEYVNERLEHLCYSRIPRRIGFGNALVENIAAGCTMVLNRPARDLVCQRLPGIALHHDWWCYLVLSALGAVAFDQRPNIKYRQHSNNLIGGTALPLELFKRRRPRFLRQEKGTRLLSDQAVEFERCYGDLLSVTNRRTLSRFLSVRGSFRERVAYFSNMDVWRQSSSDTILLRALILLGRA